ncbi:MAG TPA: carboxypeptidase-like regulatory domain-containing protein [Ohtaekwangia sp.]|uniref:TonB-dependent receptor n=1 Tax=Ohtaekwangia sp. TaxID=2066019 RepID=UPI002F936BE7
MNKFILLFFFLIFYTSISLAQYSVLEKKVSLNISAITVEEALKELSAKYEVHFYYKSTLAGLSQRVTISVYEISLRELLSRLLKDADIRYQEVNGNIILTASRTKRFSVNGYIRDQDTGEALIGASIYEAATHSGSIANTNGFYSLALPVDSAVIHFSYVGYIPQTIALRLQRDTLITIRLVPNHLLEEVVIEHAVNTPQEASSMSSHTISVNQIKSLPALLGENDVLRTLQLMPGVMAGNEGNSNLYVRGGGPDQNLVLLDGVPLYYVSHLFGMFSVFNADVISKVELVKGGFPARYAGRLSSVVDVTMKDGNMKKVHAEGSVGIISSKISVEGPITRDKTSFIFSARRTYLDLLYKPFQKIRDDGKKRDYHFDDVNLKVNHILNNRNRIYLSAYMGDDDLYFNNASKYSQESYSDSFGLSWQNIVTAFRWNSILSPRLFSNLTATYSRYRFNVNSESLRTENLGSSTVVRERNGNELISGIEDLAMKLDFDFRPVPVHSIRYGANVTRHFFLPGIYSYYDKDNYYASTISQRTPGWETDLYLEDDAEIHPRIRINTGLHFSGFQVQGTWYTSLQPRISGRYSINETTSLKASYASMMQFIHLLTSAGAGVPTDVWVPSTARIKPERSRQVALGLVKVHRHRYEFSIETYYKQLYNLIEYKDGASYTTVSLDGYVRLNPDTDWQNKVIAGGTGKSYGAEFLIRKTEGKLTGWLGYTWSKNMRQFDELNFGKPFPYRYDRRHDISLVLQHHLSDRIDLSMTWVFATGNAVTMPVAWYPNPFYDQGLYPIAYYGARNSFRMRDYHRLDLSVNFKKKVKWGLRKWTIGVYNAYNRMNPFYVETNNDRFRQYTLFPILPSISYSFQF